MNWRERKDLKWGNDLTRGIPLYARTNMHPRVSTCVGLFLVLIAPNVPAEADDGPLYVAPGPSNFISPDVIKRSQDQLRGNGQKIRRPYWQFAQVANQPRNRLSRYDQVRTLPIRDNHLCRWVG
jgi:hypothetical protein